VAKRKDRVLVVLVARLAVLVVPVQRGPFWVTEGSDDWLLRQS
jgi:hypothetical protein